MSSNSTSTSPASSVQQSRGVLLRSRANHASCKEWKGELCLGPELHQVPVTMGGCVAVTMLLLWVWLCSYYGRGGMCLCNHYRRGGAVTMQPLQEGWGCDYSTTTGGVGLWLCIYYGKGPVTMQPLQEGWGVTMHRNVSVYTRSQIISFLFPHLACKR